MGPTNERGRWTVTLPFQDSSMTLKGWSFARRTYTVERKVSDKIGGGERERRAYQIELYGAVVPMKEHACTIRGARDQSHINLD